MAWQNGPITLYHGTDDVSAVSIMAASSLIPHSVNLSKSNAFTDFGRGFYTTTSLHQAKNWGNLKYLQSLKTRCPANRAVVLYFDVNRNVLATLNSLCFVTEGSSSDYWDFVKHCRNAVGSHLFQGTNYYDIVFGPVSLWPQTLVIKDCDQVGFHTNASLQALPAPALHHQQGNPLF